MQQDHSNMRNVLGFKSRQCTPHRNIVLEYLLPPVVRITCAVWLTHDYRRTRSQQAKRVPHR